jgi:hypothetical protein
MPPTYKFFPLRQALSAAGSVLISERGIYAASPFKAIRALKRAKARAPQQMGTLPSRTESFRRRVKENWDKCSGAENAETRQVF